MILRRLTEHINEQNWLAVGIDFLIVMIGVIAGLQVSNWNAARGERHAYELALDRLVNEIDENLNILSGMDEELSRRLAVVGTGLDVHLSCEDNQANRSIISTAISGITGTTGLTLRFSAIDEITNAQTLLAQQTTEERRAFSDLHYAMTFLQREARFIEELPLRERMENNPLIGIAAPTISNRIYNGFEWSTRKRPLTLAAPVDVACKDDDLVKALYFWERWQSEMTSVSTILSQQLKASLADIKVRQ